MVRVTRYCKHKVFFRGLVMIPVIVSLFSCGSPAGADQAPVQPSSEDSIRLLRESIHADQKAYQLDTLFKNMHKLRGFNGNVLIMQQGQVLYKNAFGFANYEKKDSLKLNSAFQLASVSKTLTAAGILMLKERGLVGYADDVQKFFPDFPYKGVTVAMLLCHRSGLPNYVYFCEKYTTNTDSPLSNSQVLNWMIENKPEPYAPPGKKFHYCNTNYFLLASIIEKVSGMSYPQFMRKNIFDPLDMKNTWVRNPAEDSLHKQRTIAYNMKWKRKKDDYLDGVLGDKGIFSTVEDMSKWDRALYSEKLLKKETLKEAYAPRSFEKRGKRNYGYGWRLVLDGDSTAIIFHNGWWHGYNASFYRRPADQTCIIILGNKYCRSVYNVHGVLQILGGRMQGPGEGDGEEKESVPNNDSL